MSTLKQIDRELLRKQMLKFLAERFRLALCVKAIVTMMPARGYIDFGIEEEDVEQALKILMGKGFVAETLDDYGATKYYAVTDTGIIESERL